MLFSSLSFVHFQQQLMLFSSLSFVHLQLLLLLSSILCSFSLVTIAIPFFFHVVKIASSCCSPFLSFYSFLIVVAFFLFILSNVVAPLELIHIQSNPLLLFVIIFYFIEHQTPCAHHSNFNYVFEVVVGILQLPFWLAFEPWLIVGLISM